MTDLKAGPLMRELEDRGQYTKTWAKLNFAIAHVLFMLAIVASFGTTLIATTTASRVAVALLAAIPGLVILIDRAFSFGRRADWFYQYDNEIAALIRQLRDQDGDPAKVSQQLTATAKEMERLFPAMQASAISPISKA